MSSTLRRRERAKKSTAVLLTKGDFRFRSAFKNLPKTTERIVLCRDEECFSPEVRRTGEGRVGGRDENNEARDFFFHSLFPPCQMSVLCAEHRPSQINRSASCVFIIHPIDC